MPDTVTPVLDDLYTALRAFLLDMLPTGTEVVQGLDNRVPMPAGPGFVIMTAVTVQRLNTTIDTWDQTLTNPSQMDHESHVQVGIQLDFYGPNSFDWANMFNTVFRDDVGCQALAPSCQPLYSEEARQAPLIDGEEQYEARWLVQAQVQYNPVVSTAQTFADTLEVGLINVDERYPAT